MYKTMVAAATQSSHKNFIMRILNKNVIILKDTSVIISDDQFSNVEQISFNLSLNFVKYNFWKEF